MEPKKQIKFHLKLLRFYWRKIFSFSPNEYIRIHKRLFGDIYNHAGKIRDYNMIYEK